MDNNNNQKIEAIEIHVRTYRSLLKSAGFVEIEKLIDSHVGMLPLLHEKAEASDIDTAAFIYSLLRLPDSMSQVKKIILGQSDRVFKNNKFPEIERWQEVEAPGRRRKMYFNNKDTLAVYIASVTDVDDLISLTTAFQIEWNKLHQILKYSQDVIETFRQTVGKEDEDRFRRI